jgi:hypothetical protein
MKRRARLRPRGTLVVGSDLHWSPGLDDDSRSSGERPLEVDGHPGDGRLPAQLDSQGSDGIHRFDKVGSDGRWAAQLDSPSSDDAIRSNGHGGGERWLVLGREGGIAVDPAVAAGVARMPADRGRVLRALRTARARRLAIALGMARAARPE